MDIGAVRSDFPSIRSGKGIYLDSACQTLRPDCVIRAMDEYYSEYPACGGRSVHSMASRVSSEIDEAREKLASFFGTDDPSCYCFTLNATQALNTAAYGLGLGKGDVVVTTDSEHNSNHVPWLRLAETAGISRRMTRSKPDGEFDIDSFIDCMKGDVKAVSVQHASNVTGCTVPVKAVCDIAHDKGAVVIVDGAQAAPHRRVDLERIGADIYCMSMHKMLGPSGMGVMYGRMEVLEKLRPLSLGGGTVGLATYDSSNLAPVPERFEAGLQNYAGIIGTRAALDYLSRIGMDEVERWDRELLTRAMNGLEDVGNLHIVGPSDPARRNGILSFNIDGLGSHDIAMMADSMAGIMIRSGMHCAHPFYVARGIDGSARASTYVYNSPEEIDTLVSTVRHIAEVFGNRAQDLLLPVRQLEPSGELRVRHEVAVGRVHPDGMVSHGEAARLRWQYVPSRERYLVDAGGLEGVQHPGHVPGQGIAHPRPPPFLPGGCRGHRRGQHHRAADAQDRPGHRELDHDALTATHSLPSTATVSSTSTAPPSSIVSGPSSLMGGLSMTTRPVCTPSE
ncbi:MAG: cysteine desulfurase [Thermoplasmata archaeon]|nr:cysteine desulfurase [Thermoplasmata archaeon]